MSDEADGRLDDIVELAKRRGFFFASNSAYGGVAGFWTYGPAGAALKRNVEQRWRERFGHAEGNMEIQSPTIIPEPVFEASGHLEDFTDWIIECPSCETSHRADHLVEDAGDIEDAEGLGATALETLIDDLDVTCPTCGTALAGGAVEAFNLMFQTDIGPGGGEQGYLRPETAQGIFVDFPRLTEYARNQLPFGAIQIGPAYRNEISPRRGIIRVREMTQAELEWFYDPEEDEPDLSKVGDVSLTLYPVSAQEGDDGPIATTVSEAVESGMISNQWIGYFVGIAAEWFVSLGVDPDRLRFRQHLPGERAHYAVDCWDAEAKLSGDWIELAGFAYRSDYDLGKHHQHSDDSYTVFNAYDEPITAERATVDPDMSTLGPRFGDDAGAVVEALESLVESDPDAFESGETVTVTLNGEEHDIPIDVTGFAVETVTESGEHRLPHVAEPSFGVDRLVYTLLEHNFATDVVDGESRTYLDLSPQVAPTLAGVFPLLDEPELVEIAEGIADELSDAGLAVTYDDSGNIGRRYRRQDEVGTPFCLTIDHQTLEDGTVTLRERNSTDQRRVDRDDIVGVLSRLRDGEIAFESVGAPLDATGSQ